MNKILTQAHLTVDPVGPRISPVLEYKSGMDILNCSYYSHIGPQPVE